MSLHSRPCLTACQNTEREQIRRRARDRESDVKLPSHVRDITANGSWIKFRSSLQAFHWTPRCENADGEISNSRLEVAGAVLNDLSLIKSALRSNVSPACTLRADSETRLAIYFSFETLGWRAIRSFGSRTVYTGLKTAVNLARGFFNQFQNWSAIKAFGCKIKKYRTFNPPILIKRSSACWTGRV